MPLVDAVSRAQQGSVPPDNLSADSAWERACKVLFDVGTTQNDHGITTASPSDLAAMSTGQLIEALAQVPRGPQKAGVLKALANWWCSTFGDDADPAWTGALEDYRLELRKIRGLGPETVDRLLLFAARLPVIPIDRATLRVLVRHGWLDLPVEDESAQATLKGAFGTSIDEFQRAVTGFQDIGSQFCGREPACDACPLKPLLPPGGPIDPSAC
ncbi:MAG: hypothetical protein SFV23_27060 [Planctomycetaceae bacterium]|nr:hypothetical protein [Planctomycetaceae bacterium]